jgi:DNA-binding NtrC family response regulator
VRAELIVKKAAGDDRYPLRAARVTIGRGVHAHVRIADALASREHCVVERIGEQFVLRDLASANGTLVNGAPADEHVLAAGDRIQIGESVLIFMVDRQEAQDETKTGLDIGAEKPESQSSILGPAEVDVRACADGSIALTYWHLLAEAATGLSMRDGVAEFCDGLLRIMLRSGRFGRVAAVLCHPVTGAVTDRFTRAEAPAAVRRILLDGGDLARVFQSGVSIFRRGLRQDGRAFAALLVPLRGCDGVHGALYADDLLAAAPLPVSELHPASVVGRYAGRVLESMELAGRLQKERDTLQELMAAEADIVGESAGIQRVLEAVRGVAPGDGAVLIRGESGAGKRLVARAIHLNSNRRAGPFEVVNCSAHPQDGVESELFGQERGAAGGTTIRRKGRFELASGGTIFLNEVAELPLETQGRLHRVLEERRVRRVGSDADVAVDVRVLAGTRRDMAELVAGRAFREDLFRRLSASEIVIPPLRERGEDVMGLADHFARLFATQMGRRVTQIAPEARQLLQRHVWPGNVRELRNVIERAVLLAGGDMLEGRDFPALLACASLGTEVATLEEVERGHIAWVLAGTGGDKSAAAHVLGVSRSTLDEKLERYRIG